MYTPMVLSPCTRPKILSTLSIAISHQEQAGPVCLLLRNYMIYVKRVWLGYGTAPLHKGTAYLDSSLNSKTIVSILHNVERALIGTLTITMELCDLKL